MQIQPQPKYLLSLPYVFLWRAGLRGEGNGISWRRHVILDPRKGQLYEKNVVKQQSMVYTSHPPDTKKERKWKEAVDSSIGGSCLPCSLTRKKYAAEPNVADWSVTRV